MTIKTNIVLYAVMKVSILFCFPKTSKRNRKIRTGAWWGWNKDEQKPKKKQKMKKREACFNRKVEKLNKKITTMFIKVFKKRLRDKVEPTAPLKTFQT